MRFPRRRLTALLLLLPVATAGCAPSDDESQATRAIPAALSQSPRIARSAAGVVAAGQPLAAEAGARMLEQGGNAVDAAVATAFALSVVEPSMSGLGGRTQILIRTADGTYHGIDGTTQAPATYDPDTAPQASYGYPTVGVPGVPAGLLRALGEHGSLPRETVLAPAIELAENGYELLPRAASRFQSAADELAEFEGSGATYLKPDGTPYQAGDLVVQPDLAATLRAIAEGGHDAFYRGPIAEAIAADMAANGGAVTLEALAAYQAETSTVVRDDYRDAELVGLWIPSFGAITIEVLNLLETLPAGDLGHVQWAAALSEAIRVGYMDRPNQDDPSDARRLTSDEYAAERATLMRVPAGVEGAAAGGAATALAPPTSPLPPAWTEEPGHTTHLTAADGDGMMVAITQSLGPSFGSKVVTPGLGFVYAATLGGYLGRMEPGERARSHISPFMVERAGQPVMALGAAGGGRIPTAIVAVVSNVVDRGMSLEDALRAPRIVPEYGSMNDALDPEAMLEVALETGTGLGFSPAQLDSLRAMGFEIEEVDRDGAFGRVHAVLWHPDTGEWEGGADPDWEGAAAVPGGG